MKKVLKLFFITIFLIVSFAMILPLFIDKQKTLVLLNEKIKKEFNLDISYDEDVTISFFPFPTLKINSLIYFDKDSGIDLAIKKLNISSSWKSIVNLEPEIVSLEIFSPSLKFNPDNLGLGNDYIKLNVNNSNNYNLEKFKLLKEKIELIKISNGIINLNPSKKLILNAFNFTLRGKGDFIGSGEFEIKKYFSQVKINFNGKNFDDLNFIIQQKIKKKNKIDYNGRLLLTKENLEISGNAKSKYLTLDELFLISNDIRNLKKNKIYFTKNFAPDLKVKFNFNINAIAYEQFLLEDIIFNLLINNQYVLVDEFYGVIKKDSNVKINSTYSFVEDKFSGSINLSNFLIQDKLFGETDFDLYDGIADCFIKFSMRKKSLNFEHMLNGLDSSGFCDVGKIKFKGVDLEKTAKKVDEINDLSGLLNFLKFKDFEGNSILDFVKLKFFTKNAMFHIKELTAKHKNLELKTVGNYQMIDDKLMLNSDAKFKTKKYVNLPPLGIDLYGTLRNHKISYDFEALKERLFNEGINKILKEKKSIIIDPNSLKDLLNKGKIKDEFDPNEIIDFFLN